MTSNPKTTTKAALSVIFLGLLSACASVTHVKDVTADKVGYLDKKFSPSTLAPAILKSLPLEEKPSNFGQLKITAEVTSEQSDGKSNEKKLSWKRITTFIDKGNGLIQRMSEASNNDIPYALIYSLTYKGIFELKSQEIPLRSINAGVPYEVKQIARLDPTPSSINKEFSIDAAIGTEPQIANYTSLKNLCKTTKAISASDIHAKIPGQALELECQAQINNVVTSRSKWVLLQTYGLAIPLESVNVSTKTSIRVIGVDN